MRGSNGFTSEGLELAAGVSMALLADPKRNSSRAWREDGPRIQVFGNLSDSELVDEVLTSAELRFSERRESLLSR